MNYGLHEKYDAESGSEEYVTGGSQGEAEGAEREQKPQPIWGRTDAKDSRAEIRCFDRGLSVRTKGSVGLTYQWENFRVIARELPPLFKCHWKEIALNQEHIPLDPDWDRYFALDLAGILRCLTVRDGTTLVGYIFFFVFPHLHYASSCWAQSDIFWLDPLYREGWAGIRMFKTAEKQLQEWGAKVVTINVKLHFEASRGTIGKLLERLGYKPVETTYSKLIG